MINRKDERWEAKEPLHGMIVIASESGKEIATVFINMSGTPLKEAKANADRIVKCVNNWVEEYEN